MQATLANHETFIHAPAKDIWNMLSAVHRWPDWDDRVQNAILIGVIKESARGRVYLKSGSEPTLTIDELDAPLRLKFTLHHFGMRFTYAFGLVDLADGTVVAGDVTCSGFAASTYALFSRGRTARTLRRKLEGLKRLAEACARPGMRSLVTETVGSEPRSKPKS